MRTGHLFTPQNAFGDDTHQGQHEALFLELCLQPAGAFPATSSGQTETHQDRWLLNPHLASHTKPFILPPSRVRHLNVTLCPSEGGGGFALMDSQVLGKLMWKQHHGVSESLEEPG